MILPWGGALRKGPLAALTCGARASRRGAGAAARAGPRRELPVHRGPAVATCTAAQLGGRAWERVRRAPERAAARVEEERMARSGSTSDARAQDAWSFLTDGELSDRRLRRSFSSIPEVHRFHNRLVSGDPEKHFLEHFRETHLAAANPLDAVSLGCGDGHLERTLVGFGWPFRSLVGLELNPRLVSFAQERMASLPRGRAVTYRQADLNRLSLARSSLDLAIFFHSLHHVTEVETCVEAVARALRPGGKLLVVDYFGKNRLQRSRAHLDLCDTLLSHLPAPYRVDLSRSVPGQLVLKERCENPPREAVIRDDPSEAVRSEELERCLLRTRGLALREERPLGGTFLDPLLVDIAGNFRADDPVAVAHVRGAVSAEEALLRAGVLPSDFRYMVFERRRPWRGWLVRRC